MKKILLITHWYYPRSVPRAFRAHALYESLREKGYLVDLYIGDYKKIIKCEDYNVTEFDNLKLDSSSIKKMSGNKLIGLIKDGVNYLLGDRYLLTNFVDFNKKVNLDNYDVIISIGLPFYLHLLTSIKNILKKENKRQHEKVLIADWSDPFYGVNDVKVAPYFNYIQKMVCAQFDYNVVPTEKAVRYFDKYAKEDSIKVIPQGFNLESIYNETYKKNPVPTFGYAGIFYKDIRNPDKLLNYLTTIDTDFRFILYTITHGPIYNEILVRYKKILGEKLVINTLVPRDECIKQMSKMDFLVNLENTSDNQIPSKLIDYTLSGRPILSLKQDDIFEDKIVSFINNDFSLATKIKIEDYDINRVVDKFRELWERE